MVAQEQRIFARDRIASVMTTPAARARAALALIAATPSRC
jgi:hypothetical protein